MGKHRVFNADHFLEKFQGRESLLREYVAQWNGRVEVDCAALDVPRFREFLISGDGVGNDELLEGLYRAYDLCTERGHEDLVAACREFMPYDPDPEGKLPVECLSLKVRTENEDAFTLAYDRNTLWSAERFSVFRGGEARPITNVAAAAPRLQAQLAEAFKDHKGSDRVLVRQYQEGPYSNFIVYHEKRSKAELVFKGARRVVPTILRPAQQDFISYNGDTGQVEIEARFQNEEAMLRKHFAECCLGDKDFFEGKNAANRLNLSAIAEYGFDMPVNDEHAAALVELHFNLRQHHSPSFVVRSKDIMATLETNNLRSRVAGGEIRRAVFKITFPDDRRGKRVELAGTNTVKFKRATHADEVFRYLRRWGVALA